MAQIKKTGLRAIRKSAHLSSRVLNKGSRFTERVEDKATRILTGKDYSMLVDPEVPVEKVLFNGVRYNIAPLNPALPAVGRGGKVTLLIPSLNRQSFFGGTATALIIAGKLAQKLHRPLRIVETLASGGKDGLGDFMQENGIDLTDEVELIDVSARTYERYGYLDLHPDDVVMASAWWDARLLSRLPIKRKFIYLIQDFEPIFYPNSDEYAYAESTYHTGNFLPVCNTELMYTFMSAQGYEYIKKNGVWFEPAVSKKQYGVAREHHGKKRLFLYGRPSVARNLFYSAIDAINQAFSNGLLDSNEWELFMAGQDKLPSIKLSTGISIQNLGKLSMNQYEDFIPTVDLAVSPMMAPHPNYPTLEFASVGAAVVTTKYGTKQDLTRYSKNIFMAEANVESIMTKIGEAGNTSVAERLATMQSDAINDDWGTALDNVLTHLAKKLR